MKKAIVMIIRTAKGRWNDPDSLSLKQCGFKVGDLVEIYGHFRDGTACCDAIRDGVGYGGIVKGDSISLEPEEFVVVEGEV